MKKFLLITIVATFIFSQTIDEIVDNFTAYTGKTLTIEGVLLNDFGNLRGDRTSIYIVSPKGKALNLSSRTKYTNLKRGQRVRVTGKVNEYQDVYQISPSGKPTVLENNVSIPDPIEARTGDINPVRYHGDYIKVQGIIKNIRGTGTSGSNIDVDDGTGLGAIRVWTTTKMTIAYLTDTLGLKVGDAVTIRGATSTFRNAGQVLPSVRSDIQKGFAGDDKHPESEIYLSVKAQVYDIQLNESIEFNLKAPVGAQVRLTIYNFGGTKIKSFAYFSAIGTSELKRWDKLSDNFQKVKLGSYILLMEVVEVNGRRTIKKVPIVIGARL